MNSYKITDNNNKEKKINTQTGNESQTSTPKLSKSSLEDSNFKVQYQL